MYRRPTSKIIVHKIFICSASPDPSTQSSINRTKFQEFKDTDHKLNGFQLGAI